LAQAMIDSSKKVISMLLLQDVDKGLG